MAKSARHMELESVKAYVQYVHFLCGHSQATKVNVSSIKNARIMKPSRIENISLHINVDKWKNPVGCCGHFDLGFLFDLCFSVHCRMLRKDPVEILCRVKFRYVWPHIFLSVDQSAFVKWLLLFLCEWFCIGLHIIHKSHLVFLSGFRLYMIYILVWLSVNSFSSEMQM